MAVTLALGASVPAKVVSGQLGQPIFAFTLDTYSHVLPHMQEAAVDQLEPLLSRSDCSRFNTALTLSRQALSVGPQVRKLGEQIAVGSYHILRHSSHL